MSSLGVSLIDELNTRPFCIAPCKHYSMIVHPAGRQEVAFFIDDSPVSEAVFSESISKESEFQSGVMLNKSMNK